jgi:hypothetical protein
MTFSRFDRTRCTGCSSPGGELWDIMLAMKYSYDTRLIEKYRQYRCRIFQPRIGELGLQIRPVPKQKERSMGMRAEGDWLLMISGDMLPEAGTIW